MLTLHRRHLKSCERSGKGWNYTLCECPIWCDGLIDGHRFTRSLQTTNWDRAVSKANAIDRGVDVGIEVEPGRTVARAVSAFLKTCESRNLKQSSIASYTRTLTRFSERFGTRHVGRIAPSDISDYLNGRKIKSGEPLGPRTRRKEIEYLRALFAWCVEQGWCSDNPAKRVRPPRIEDLTATLPFTGEEIGQILDACDQMRGMWKEDTPDVRRRARALVLTLLYSGLRVGDVAQLKRSALERSGHLVIRVMKTGVPLKVLLHGDAAAALESLPAPSGNPKYFFWSGNGDIDDCSKSLWRTVSRVGKLAGVHAHPHRFRDTFAVELLSSGADIRTVQKLLGHESVRTTEKHYAHFVAAHQALLDSATARLDFRPSAARPILVRPAKKRLGNS